MYGRLQRRVQPSIPVRPSVQCHHTALTHVPMFCIRETYIDAYSTLRLPHAFLSKCERGRGGKEKHGAECQCRVRFVENYSLLLRSASV